jgi:hypothetical protein
MVRFFVAVAELACACRRMLRVWSGVGLGFVDSKRPPLPRWGGAGVGRSAWVSVWVSISLNQLS